jgi:hypothetical protein
VDLLAVVPGQPGGALRLAAVPGHVQEVPLHEHLAPVIARAQKRRMLEQAESANPNVHNGLALLGWAAALITLIGFDRELLLTDLNDEKCQGMRRTHQNSVKRTRIAGDVGWAWMSICRLTLPLRCRVFRRLGIARGFSSFSALPFCVSIDCCCCWVGVAESRELSAGGEEPDSVDDSELLDREEEWALSPLSKSSAKLDDSSLAEGKRFKNFLIIYSNKNIY